MMIHNMIYETRQMTYKDPWLFCTVQKSSDQGLVQKLAKYTFDVWLSILFYKGTR